MSILAGTVSPSGAIIEIAIGVSGPRADAMRAAGQTPPAPEIINVLIDTGASSSVIDSSVIQKLGLIPTGVTPILTPSTGSVPHNCNQYDVALWILMGTQGVHRVSLLIPVIEADLSRQGIEGLIGRDVLSKGTLWYNGQQNTLSLAF
jgi:hypothetical protein